MCDAEDTQSKCALGCQKPTPGNDLELNVLNENEKIDKDELFEQAEEINFELEILLDAGSTDNQTDEQAAIQLQNELFKIYDEVNPFEDGETTVDVKIDEIEVCELVEENLNSIDSNINEEQACNVDDTTSTRKKRGTSKRGRRRRRKNAKVEASFKSPSSSPISVSSKVLRNLEGKVSAITKSSKNKNSVAKIAKLGAKIAESMSFKLENWMETMPDHMKEIPATLLAIPGTHNSHTHSMQTSMDMSQDAPLYGEYGNKLVKRYKNTKFVIEAWGRCIKKEHGIYKQLEMGLRYFDFR